MLTHGFGRPRALARLGLVLVACAGAIAPGCQKIPLTAPSSAAMAIVASTSTLALNGSADVTAVVMEGVLEGTTVAPGGGTPVHNGTLVTFTTTLGRIEPVEAKTTAGRATVRLIADGRAGTATVTAFSGAVTNSIDVTIGPVVTDITVTANPQTLPGTGGSTTISASVEDVDGNGLSGVPVSFSTTNGNLSATRVTTGGDGLASTTLTTTQNAEVTASAAGITGTVSVVLKPRAVVSITAPASATVGVPATLTLTPTTGAVLTKVEVDFGDGERADLGAMTSATPISHLFRFPGAATVTVRATDSEGRVESTSTQLAIAPLLVTLAATPVSTTQPQVGTLVTFTATPTTGAAIERYEWNLGDGNTAITNSNQHQKAYGAPAQYVVSVRAVPFGDGTPATAVLTLDVKP